MMWYAIGTGYGVILKFDSVEELREVAARLDGMANWAEEQIAAGKTVKLAFSTMPDDLGEENKRELSAFTDSLPDARLRKEAGQAEVVTIVEAKELDDAISEVDL